ncbi:MAG TPA: glycosyltransferase [Egibacteraceae bacterium]|nr:glycosyltransferase [Egibacteraceae bacterium]
MIPAYNEERWLPATVTRLQESLRHLSIDDAEVEIAVVDNASDDSTAAVATKLGCRVVREPVRGIARARNAGARATAAQTLFFVDADTILPLEAVAKVCEVMRSGSYAGGAFIADYQPEKRMLRLYHEAWARYAAKRNMTQGVAQFCDREFFTRLGGYDTSLHMGEDNDFFWRLTAAAADRGLGVYVDPVLRVLPSTRRLDQWPVWRTLLWTNPWTIKLFRRSSRFWRHWYGDRTPR